MLAEIKADDALRSIPVVVLDDLQGRGGHRPHLRPRRQLLHHEAGHVRGPRAGDGCVLALLARDRRASQRARGVACTGPARERRLPTPPLRCCSSTTTRRTRCLTRDLLERIEGTRYRADWVDRYADALAAVDDAEYDVCLVDYRLGAGGRHRPRPRARGERIRHADHRPDRPRRSRAWTSRRRARAPPTTSSRAR